MVRSILTALLVKLTAADAELSARFAETPHLYRLLANGSGEEKPE